MKPDINDPTQRLAWWLGVSHCVGSDMCYWLITESSKIISKSSVECVTHDDYLHEEIKKRIDKFNHKLKESLDENNFEPIGVLNLRVCILMTSTMMKCILTQVLSERMTSLQPPRSMMT